MINLRVFVHLGQMLKAVHQLPELPPDDLESSFDLQHRRAVHDVLRRSTPMNVFGVLGRYHRSQLFDEW